MPKFCSECGAEAEGMKFCPECGTALEGGATTATAAAPAQVATVEEEEERQLWTGQPDRVFASMGERSSTYVLTTERLQVDSGKGLSASVSFVGFATTRGAMSRRR